MFPALAFWLAFTGLMAWGQGKLMPTLKTVPPNTHEASRNNFALHWVLGAAWALFGLPIWYYSQRWELAVMGVLVRIAIFDIVLNAAEGSPLFAVGGEANTDKILRAIAAFFGWNVQVLSAVFKALALLVLAVGMWKNCC